MRFPGAATESQGQGYGYNRKWPLQASGQMSGTERRHYFWKILGMLEDAASLEEAGARDMNLKIMPSLPLHPVCREVRSLLFYISPTLRHSGQAHGQVNKGLNPLKQEAKSDILSSKRFQIGTLS